MKQKNSRYQNIYQKSQFLNSIRVMLNSRNHTLVEEMKQTNL